MPGIITMCVFGNPVDKSELAEEGTTSCTPEAKPERTFAQNATLLSFCFVGLQVRIYSHRLIPFLHLDLVLNFPVVGILHVGWGRI